MSVDELLGHVPPEVVYRRVPLPPQQNAWPLWEEAVAGIEAVSSEIDRWSDLYWGTDEPGEYAPWPTDEEAGDIRELLRREQWRLDRFEEGLDRGRPQVPMSEPGGEIVSTSMELRTIVRLRWLLARSHVAEGRADEALGICLGSLRAGEMLFLGEGMIVDWLLALAFYGLAWHGVGWLLENAELNRESLHRALAALRAESPFADALATSLKVDLVYDLGTLDRLPDPADAPVLAEALYRNAFSRRCIFGDGELMEVPESDPRVQWVREKIHFLLDDHPRPFDKIATAQILGRAHVEAVRACDELEHKPADEVTKALEASPLNEQIRGKAELWPNVLIPMFSLEAIGDTEEAAQYRNSMVELFDDDPEMREFYRIPSDEEFAAMRQRIRETENPVGWWFINTTAPATRAYFGFVARENQRREELAERITRRLGSE